MLNSGKKNVLSEKKILNETKTILPPPLPPYYILCVCFVYRCLYFFFWSLCLNKDVIKKMRIWTRVFGTGPRLPLLLNTIVLSVLQYIDSNYSFGIFKLFLHLRMQSVLKKID
jgi:hypothetical protein